MNNFLPGTVEDEPKCDNRSGQKENCNLVEEHGHRMQQANMPTRRATSGVGHREGCQHQQERARYIRAASVENFHHVADKAISNVSQKLSRAFLDQRFSEI